MPGEFFQYLFILMKGSGCGRTPEGHAMIVDSHTHLFAASVEQDRSPYFENEPEFKLLYDSPKSRITTVPSLISTMDRHGVDLSVVSGFPWRNPDYARQNNDAVIEAVTAHPDRIRGLACFDLAWEGAAKEAQRCLDAGLSGVGELAFYLSGIDERAIRLLEPVMDLEAVTPEEYVGDVISDLNSKRGKVTGIEAENDVQIVRAHVPLAEMFGYSTSLRSATQGRAHFSMQFLEYDVVPKAKADKIIRKIRGI